MVVLVSQILERRFQYRFHPISAADSLPDPQNSDESAIALIDKLKISALLGMNY